MDNPSTRKSTGGAPQPQTTPTAIRNLPIELQNDQKRRSSSRSIKRKRFDDEIVEYSVGFPQSRGGENHRVGRPRTISQTQGAARQSPGPSLPPPPPPLLVTTPSATVGSPSSSTPAATAALSVNKETDSPIASVEASTNSNTVASNNNPSKTAVQIASSSGTPNHPSNTPQTPSLLPATSTPLVMEHRSGPAGSALADKRRSVRAPGGGARKSRKGGRPPSSVVATKDLGRWKPIDDLALIIGIQQTNDLRMVHRGTKFSCKFTLQEMQTRWYSLLYEPAISRIAVAAMRNLHPELVESVQRKALYSVQEEEMLANIKSTDNPKLEQFQELLEKNASVFYCARTAKCVMNHWQMMKQYQLLADQVVKPLHISDQPLSFSDAEDLILDADLNEHRDESLEVELTLTDRQHKREIRLLENELSRWNVLVDSITGIQPEFDGQTLAVLRGRLVRYLMRSKEITFGRDAKDCIVDVDLSLEGPACKISRRQGTIKLRSNGDFFIANEGKRPVFIDGVPLLMGNKTRLANNCVLEISGLRFVFLVNYELINAIRHESAKTTAALN